MAASAYDYKDVEDCMTTPTRLLEFESVYVVRLGDSDQLYGLTKWSRNLYLICGETARAVKLKGE